MRGMTNLHVTFHFASTTRQSERTADQVGADSEANPSRSNMSEVNMNESMRALSMRNEMEEPLAVAECVPCETGPAAE